MNLRRLLLIAAVLLLAVSCKTVSSAKNSPLDGAWEFVSGKYTGSDGKVSEVAAPQTTSLKVLSESRFAFITVRADGSFIRAAGGPFTITGNTYAEHLEKSSVDSIRGRTYTFQWRVEGDVWYHSGTNEGVRYEEVWRRAR